MYKQLEAKSATITTIQTTLAEQAATISTLNSNINQANQKIHAQEEATAHLHKQLKEKEATIANQGKELRAQYITIADLNTRGEAIEVWQAKLNQEKATINIQAEEIDRLDEKVDDLNSELLDKSDTIRNLDYQLQKKNRLLRRYAFRDIIKFNKDFTINLPSVAITSQSSISAFIMHAHVTFAPLIELRELYDQYRGYAWKDFGEKNHLSQDWETVYQTITTKFQLCQEQAPLFSAFFKILEQLEGIVSTTTMDTSELEEVVKHVAPKKTYKLELQTLRKKLVLFNPKVLFSKSWRWIP